MQNYVVGFPLNIDGDETILIKKKRPKWQKGYFNGVGGHIEKDETPAEAMSREFLEEAGALINPENWTCYIVLSTDQRLDREVAYIKQYQSPRGGLTD